MKDKITFKIKYDENMDMKELVDAINNTNESMMTGFAAMIQKQTDITLQYMNTRFDEIAEILKRLEKK